MFKLKDKIFLLCCLAISLSSVAMEPVTDEELSAISAQDGLTISDISINDSVEFVLGDSGTELHPFKAFAGVEGAFLNASGSLAIDAGSHGFGTGEASLSLRAQFTIADKGFNLGNIIFDPNYDPGVLGGTGFSADKIRIAEFTVTEFQADPFDLWLFAGGEESMAVFASAGINLWEGTLAFVDRDGNGNAQLYEDVPAPDASWGADFVWGALWDDALGDKTLVTTNDPDDLLDFSGTKIDLVEEGMVLQIPVLRGKYEPANPKADADGYLGFGGILRNVYFGDQTTSAFTARLNFQIPQPLNVTMYGV